MKLSAKTKGGLMVAFVLLSFVTVRAATSYSVTVDGEVNVSAFPAVEVNLNIGGDTAGLAPNALQILEKGVENHGPLVILPPAPAGTKIDLFILLDTAGLRENGAVIKRKLEALADTLEADQTTDVKLYLSTLGGNQPPKGIANAQDFRNQIAALGFGTGIPAVAGGFKEISDLADASSIARSGSQKVLLIINGTPFYRGKGVADDDTYSGLDTMIGRLQQNFITFVVGYPFRSLQAFSSPNALDEKSPGRTVPGGYMGSFSTDLSRIIDLLKTRDATHFKLYYTSGLKLTEASGANVEIAVGGSAGNFSYPAISQATPIFSYLTAPTVMLGDSVPVRIEVEPMGKMVSEAELTYMGKGSSKQTQLLKLNRLSSTAEALVYEGEIPAGDYPPKEDLSFFATVYTPYNMIGGEQDRDEVAVESVDKDIILKPRADKNGEGKVTGVTWTLSGDTVAMGSKYEIYYGGDEPPGDKPLKELSASQKVFTIPIVGECDQYQIIKARVWVRAGQPHPKQGDWSLFSPSFEFFDEGANRDSVTEEVGVRKMIGCLEKPAYETYDAFIKSGIVGYSATRNLNLNTLLYYLTAISDPLLKDVVEVKSRYGLLYLFMNVINQTEYDTYSADSTNIPLKLVYKVITAVNQIDDHLKEVFNDSLGKLEIRLRGNVSI